MFYWIFFARELLAVSCFSGQGVYQKLQTWESTNQDLESERNWQESQWHDVYARLEQFKTSAENPASTSWERTEWEIDNPGVGVQKPQGRENTFVLGAAL